MSKLEELIQELCPDGVEYKEIGEIFEKITDYTAAGSFADIAKNVKYNREREFAQLIRTTDLKTKFINEDTFVYVTEKAFNYLWRVNLDKESIIMPNVGNCGEVYFVKPEDLINNNNVLGPNAILLRTEKNNLKYLYYCIDSNSFKNKLLKITSSTGQTKFNKTNLKKLTLPVPPLEVQCEIVRILDKFTLLTAELTAELTARRKQYEYYMGDLLFFGKYDNKNKVYNLGELCTKLKGIAITAGQMKKITSENGEVRIFAGGKTRVDVKSDSINNDDIIKVPNIIVQSRGIIDFIYYDKPCSFKREMWSYTNGNNITLKYIYYYLKNNVGYFRQRGSQMGSMPQISLEITEKYKIPIPSIYEQEKIVKILERFDKLCNDITSGIPAEIELNNKRYEYYRDKLLNFKEKR